MQERRDSYVLAGDVELARALDQRNLGFQLFCDCALRAHWRCRVND
jgi:hypothetical protein